jgi:anti-sigma regulatory factor (Ser/Thr protein kinase)
MLCIAVAELTTSFRHELDADPAELRPLRTALGRWLAAMGVDEQPAFDVMLATSEATSNAIEHGHRCNGARGIAVELDAVDEGLRVTVRDAGSWRQSSAAGDRGRGLPLMRTLMDSVQVEPSSAGTVVTMERRLGGGTS